ncbi:histidine kinase [Candidatus Izimaplasma bacterium ZiA1]|uniref:GAF domain-containing protein n=1 Tax=Candidatus Izimoplasma sp. ZiA1 TaxID=2024899 RepID=UPI000BAA5004|nr:histidine kinase [Candidatus Izimaplasma bacterium ZiA1]
MFVEVEKKNNKVDNYKLMIENAPFYLNKGDNLVTSLANISALINYFIDGVNWVGFYLFDGNKLYLGPFQGLPACTQITMGSGVCGNSALDMKTYIVYDVDAFPGHIACDSNSKSEIVIPIIKDEQLIGVLDIDSPLEKRFDENDKKYLEKVISLLVDFL